MFRVGSTPYGKAWLTLHCCLKGPNCARFVVKENWNIRNAGIVTRHLETGHDTYMCKEHFQVDLVHVQHVASSHYLGLPFIDILLSYISGHSKICYFTAFSFPNQNITSSKIPVNDLKWRTRLRWRTTFRKISQADRKPAIYKTAPK